MKASLLACLLLSAAISPARAQAPSSAVNMNGSIQISFEQAEFTHQGQTYYLNDERGVLSNWIAQQRAASKAFFIQQNICVNGYIQTKAQNHNHGFGALGRYERAIVVQKRC